MSPGSDLDHQTSFTPGHGSTSKLPSKSSQPPIAMAKTGAPFMDYDTRVYHVKKYRTQFASAPACLVSLVVGSPFENIKTRMQSQHFKNAAECLKYTYRTEGLRGFWAGTAAPVFSMTITRVTQFSVYQHVKYVWDEVAEKSTGISPLKEVNTPGVYPRLSTILCFTGSGAICGAAISPFTAPFELIKNATQTSVLMSTGISSHRGPTIGSVAPDKGGRVSSWDAFKQIVRNRGYLGLYTGFRLHLLRDTVGTGIYFGVYETTKASIKTYQGSEQSNTNSAIAIAGFICGVMSWGFTYPLDTMKTRAQNMLVGTAARRVAHEAAAKASPSSKWKGVEMVIARSSIQNMIQMSVFEFMKEVINNARFEDGGTSFAARKRAREGDRVV